MTSYFPQRLLLAAMAAAALGGCAELTPMFERNPSGNHPKAESRGDARGDSRGRAEQRGDARTDARADTRADTPAGREQLALREGIRLYNEGDFNGAIKRLASNDIRASAPPRTRTMALKYTAFSYCVTSRPKQCQQAFERALKIDPDFSLDPGEEGHPLWGPAFARAKGG